MTKCPTCGQEAVYSQGFVDQRPTYTCEQDHTWFGTEPTKWVEVSKQIVLRPYTVEHGELEFHYQQEMVDLGLMNDVYGFYRVGTVLYLQNDRTMERYQLLIGDTTEDLGSCRHCPWDFGDDTRILAFKFLDFVEPSTLSYES